MNLYPHPKFRFAVSALSAAISASRSGAIAVAACVGELVGGKVPTEIQLFPAGEFSARDGRPGTEYPQLKAWHLSGQGAARIIAEAAATRGDYVIDYEHQTLHAEDNGLPAPAAGWFHTMEWREGDGLYATDVRWTDKARRMIEAGEYRYISPVFNYDKSTGEVSGIQMAALTNYPGLDGHSDLAARAAARFSTQENHEEESTVDRKKLIKLLGLKDDASDEEIQAALKAATDAQGELAALRKELGVGEEGDAKSAVAALKSKEPDMGEFVPKAVHDETRAQLAALRLNGEQAEVDRLIEDGLKDGRIAGQATADWLRKQGLAALKAHLKDSAPVAALTATQTDGRKPKGGGRKEDGELSEEELAVCKNMGIDPKTYKGAK